jgi:hypothetical protein
MTGMLMTTPVNRSILTRRVFGDQIKDALASRHQTGIRAHTGTLTACCNMALSAKTSATRSRTTPMNPRRHWGSTNISAK